MKKFVILSMIILASIGYRVEAQNNMGLPFLLQNTETRSLGMGNTFVHDTQSKMHLYNNFASVFANDSHKWIGSYSLSIYPKVEDSRQLFHAFSTSYVYDKHAFGIGARYWRGLTVQARNEMGDNYQFKPNDATIDLAYAYQFIDNLSASVGASYIYSYNGVTLNAYSFSLGLFHKGEFGIGDLAGDYSIAATANNIAPKVKYSNSTNYFQLPTYLGVHPSVSLEVSEGHSLALALSGGSVLTQGKQPFIFGTGLEYDLLKMISFRAGYYSGYEKFFTFGGGFRIDNFSLDAAYQLGKSNDFNVLKIGLSCHF